MRSEPRREPVDVSQLCELMDAVFAQDGVFRFAPTGGSMRPMLREKRDTVVLAPVRGNVRKYDVILYRRADGQIVLHRVIRVEKSGDLVLCGDAQVEPERGICPGQVRGVLTSFSRDGREVSARCLRYRAYAVLWVASRPVRRVFRRVKRLFR